MPFAKPFGPNAFNNLKITNFRLTFYLFVHLLILFRIPPLNSSENSTISNFSSTTYLSDYNDTFYFINDSIVNDSFAFNNSQTNESITDVATELDSTMSVTEDTYYSQSNILFLTPDEDICNCDLTWDVCDINCCCDSDCSEEDIKVFSECSHQTLVPDENYCYQKNIILKNNTIYKMVQDPKSSMFCIVHDNLKYHLRYRDMPVLKSHRDLSSVLKYKYKRTFSWDSETIERWSSLEIKSGSPVYIREPDMQISTKWTLPSSCLSDACSCQLPVQYLQDFQSSCSHSVDLERNCADDKVVSGEKFLSFCVSSESASSFTDSMVNLIIHSKASASNDSDEYSSETMSDLCPASVSVKPVREGNLCKNVVTGIDFIVLHNGISGITKITASVLQRDLAVDVKTISQMYTVKFLWINATDPEKKSGNPGYHVGHPVLVATNISEARDEEKEVYLTVLGRDINSFCSSQRVAVGFGQNLNFGCFLKNEFSDCRSVHEKVLDIFFGSQREDIFVGVFGNANRSNPNDWIEAFREGPSILEATDCFVSLGLKVDIAYAAVGSTANPQYKIVGVNQRLLKPQFVDLKCFHSCSNIVLSTTVSFFDVTLPAEHQYAKVPSIKINLPSDFFYPFMYGQSRIVTSNVILVFILCGLILVSF